MASPDETPDASRKWTRILLIVLVAIGFGFTIHPNVAGFAVERISTWLRICLPGIAIICAITGAGVFVVPSRLSQSLGRGNFLLASLATGVGPFSIIILLLGIVGWLQSLVLLSLSGILMIGGLYRWKRLFPFTFEISCDSRSPASSGPCLPFNISAGILVAAVILLGMVALCPPLLFDVTEYHLGAWTSYFSSPHAARFIPMFHNFYARFPFPVESLYFSGLLIDPSYDAAPKIINAFFVLAAALATANLARRLGGANGYRPAIIAVALAHPVMLAVSLDAFIDAPVAFFVVMSINLLLPSDAPYSDSGFEVDISEEQANPYLWVSALCFSIALAAKYTTAQVFLLPWLILAVRPLIILLRRRHYVSLLAFIAALCLVPAAWFAKNIWFYGNPLEPFFEWMFSHHNPAALAREHFYINAHHPQSLWSLSYWTSFVPRMRLVAPILIAPALCLAVPRLRHRTSHASHLAVFCLLAYCLWNLVGASEDRFLLPAMLILTALAFAIITQIDCHIARRMAVVLFLIWAGLNLFQQGLKFANAKVFSFAMDSDFFPLSRVPENPPNLPPDSREVYLSTNLGAIGTITNFINRELPAESRIMMIFEARPWFVRRSTTYNTVWDDSQFLAVADGATTSAQIWERLAAAGYTDILVNRQELRRYIQQYARPDQLAALNIPQKADHARAFDATDTPEDLFPPFYQNHHWKQMREPVIAFLREAEATARLKDGPGRLTVFVTPVPRR